MNDIITRLKTPTKPKGKEWFDIEAWWNQLVDKEGTVRDLMTALRGGDDMWALEDVNEFTKWDDRITVLDQFPLYRNIPRDLVSADMRRVMDYSDESGGSYIIYLQV